ncbi:MAG: T9SS type A sorting domain-containing protein [Ignavibacteriae bacterium]|nr:T9SS type A sorting domain-containing protein [Ignavibacteriota bacterium]
MKNLYKYVFVFYIIVIPNLSEAQWVHAGSPGGNLTIYSFASAGQNLFAGTYGGVFLTTNGGSTWTSVNNGFPAIHVYALIFIGSELYAGTFGSGVFRSNNNGKSWNSLNSGLTNLNILSFVKSGSNLFAGTYGGGVFLSTNNGASWTQRNAGLPSNSQISALIMFNTTLFAGTYTDQVFRSTNNGLNWTLANNGLPNSDVVAFSILGNTLFSASRAFGNSIYKTTDNGITWIPSNSGLRNDYFCVSLCVEGSNIFTGSDGVGVYLSTNSGANWTAVNSGLTDASVLTLSVYGDYLYAGTAGGIGVWKRPLSEIISIQNISTIVPNNYRLEQNYPNPFNPVTKIEFSIPKQGDVKITVYNSLGKEVASLLDQKLSAGIYNVHFDGTNNSSGVYFYIFEMDDFVQTKSMVLLK